MDVAPLDRTALAAELGIGQLTLDDMIEALCRPGRDPREDLPPPIFRKDVVKFDDLQAGMELRGTVLNVVDFGMNVQDAIDAPRFHHQWLPDVLSVEQDGLPLSTVSALEAMGYHVNMRGRQGTAHSIRIDPRTGDRQGAADPRDADAGAAGY